jgi:hypothetical protein
MSDGPVYCPKDQLQEFKWSWPLYSYVCPRCGLIWNGKFPVKENVYESDGSVIKLSESKP